MDLEITVKGAAPRTLPIGLGRVEVGAAAAVVIDDPKQTVSRRHLAIKMLADGSVEVEDLGSRNGTFVGDSHRRLASGERARLPMGEVFFAGPNVRLKVIASGSETEVIPREGGGETVVRALQLPPGEKLLIGRDPRTADIPIDHPQVSRRHCLVARVEGGFEVRDLGSKNGTFVNGRRIYTMLVKAGDVLGVGPMRFEIPAAGVLRQVEERGGIQLDCRGLAFTLPRKTILRPTNLTIRRGEFAGILGTSGSGKTVLLTRLCGANPYDEGCVWMNGVELADNFEWLRMQIGYVPQKDIIHTELGVGDILRYTAKLRSEPDVSDDMIDDYVAKALAIVGMPDKTGDRFSTLSGGQQKKINVAVELVNNPNIFFLDEPTASVDPAQERGFMELFREYAHGHGKTVAMVTHVTENVRLMDKIAVMAPGGDLAFFGAPEESLEHFGVADYVEIYEKLKETPPVGETWTSRYRRSGFGSKYRYGDEPITPVCASGRERKDNNGAPLLSRIRSWFLQIGLLTARYVRIILGDKKNLGILAIQAPVVAGLAALIFWGTNSLEAAFLPVRTLLQDNVLFLVTLASLWFGTNNAAREIVKELSVYKRERMVFLRLGPYIFSKVIVLAALCLIQCAVMLAILKPLLDYGSPPQLLFGANVISLLGVIWATSLAGVAVGLFISAAVKTENMAVSLVPLILIPQIVFSGVLRPVDIKGEPYPGEVRVFASAVSKATVAFWSYEAARELASAGRGSSTTTAPPDELQPPPAPGEMGSPAAAAEGIARERALAVTRELGLIHAQPAGRGVKTDLAVILGFVPVFLVLSAAALKRKEREGFATQ